MWPNIDPEVIALHSLQFAAEQSTQVVLAPKCYMVLINQRKGLHSAASGIHCLNQTCAMQHQQQWR